MKQIILNRFWLGTMAIILIISCQNRVKSQETQPQMGKKEFIFKVEKPESEWKKELTPEQYAVLREAATERPFTGEYNMHFEEGVYKCAACGEKLFSSSSKFDSHCGWPSFDEEIEKGKIVERLDRSHGMIRMEILCGNCGSHLGHIFNDGPTKTGLRYCVNSLSLDFEKEKKKEE